MLHTLEWLAELAKGADWRKILRKAADHARDEGGVRVVDDSTL